MIEFGVYIFGKPEKKCQESRHIVRMYYSGYHYRPELKDFFFDSNLRFGGRQSTVTMVFTRWPREDSFPVSRARGGKCRRLSRFCSILLQDLTPLHVKITRSTNLLSVCRRKFKLSIHLHTVLSYNHAHMHKLSQ